MADYAPNFTARLRIRYSTGGRTHSLVWRAVAGTTDPAGITAKMGLFLADLAPNLYNDWNILSADWAPADSDVFLPTPMPTSPTGAVAAGGAPNSYDAFSLSFVGRSTMGHKARFFIYGSALAAEVALTTGVDFRFRSAEIASISAGIVRLNETSPLVAANDGVGVVWYEYANGKYNDYWVRRLRAGA